MNLRLLFWRIFVGWKKVTVLSYGLNGTAIGSATITKWQKRKMDYHLSQVHRKDWIWWNDDQYANEIQ